MVCGLFIKLGVVGFLLCRFWYFLGELVVFEGFGFGY